MCSFDRRYVLEILSHKNRDQIFVRGYRRWSFPFRPNDLPTLTKRSSQKNAIYSYNNVTLNLRFLFKLSLTNEKTKTIISKLGHRCLQTTLYTATRSLLQSHLYIGAFGTKKKNGRRLFGNNTDISLYEVINRGGVFVPRKINSRDLFATSRTLIRIYSWNITLRQMTSGTQLETLGPDNL